MDPQLMVFGGLALIGLLAVWRSGRKSVKKAHKGVREVTRLGGNLLRTLVTTVLIVAAQWAVISWWASPVVLAVALVMPALFAGGAVAHLLSVKTYVHSGRGGVRR